MEPYKVVTIPSTAAQEPESLGTKAKFWYREEESSDAQQWLFKFPQQGTGQHWAEKIAAEVAQALGVSCARVELARFGEARGSIGRSFVAEGTDLVHGNQLLAATVFDYEPDRRFGQSSHTFTNILRAIHCTFPEPAGLSEALEALASYLVLDALIGNTDRHHENWGVLVGSDDPASLCVAPSFDHASSLGRELQDETGGKSRREKLRGRLIPTYSNRAPGAIYWQEDDRHGLSPLELVRRAYRLERDIFEAPLLGLERIDLPMLRSIVDRIPSEWMSDLARTFAFELMSYNLGQLREIGR